MIISTKNISLRKAALIAGLSLLVSVATAPFAELYALPKLIIQDKAAETVQNIIANQSLFIAAIFSYLLAFICDLTLAWSLYILLRPVNADLSLLTAWLRLTYTIIALVALNNLITVFRLLTTSDYLILLGKDQLYAQAMIYLRAFRNHWYFGIIFFGIHLLFLGFLIIRSNYIPKLLGIILLVTGMGYLLTTLQPYLFPNLNVDFAQYTFYGELIFMLWLLLKGSRLKEQIQT
jgi:hypothetical protein